MAEGLSTHFQKTDNDQDSWYPGTDEELPVGEVTLVVDNGPGEPSFGEGSLVHSSLLVLVFVQ